MHTLQEKLIEEFVIVAVVCAAFLLHLRSALVAVITLPLGVLAAFIVMHYQGVSANLMSLGGIAIAIGAMTDAAIVMIENAHKHLERWREANAAARRRRRVRLIGAAATEVGPALFLSLLIITLSFLPILTLEAQEGRLFAPLAWTKTYAMAAAAGLAVTLVPVLMSVLIRGRLRAERQQSIEQSAHGCLSTTARRVLLWPRLTLLVALALVVVTLWPLQRLGAEFMPPLDEGDLLYMPTAQPGLRLARRRELLQQTDQLIRTVPEVARVFGKAGRTETATDRRRSRCSRPPFSSTSR